MADSEAAAAELQRTSTIPGFCGAMINGMTDNLLRSQVFITTSGFFSMPPLEVAITTFGIERILFSVDYPYSTNRQGADFLDKLSMRLAEEEVELIAHGNAERLLKLEFGM